MKNKVWIVLALCCSLWSRGQNGGPETNFQSPLDIPLILSGTFGELRSNHFHAGIDIKTQQRQGLPVYAVEDGTVSRIKISHWGYGKALYIAHPNGYTSVYAHLQKFGPEIEAYVKKLQYEKQRYEVEVFPQYGELTVSKGDTVAYSGNTGGSSGPHLHFEIRNSMDEKPTNPLLYGFSVRDATNPNITGLFAYPLSDSAQVNQSQKRIEIPFSRQADGTYLAEPVTASGLIGFGIETYDRQDLAANKNGVYRVEQRVNGKTYTDMDFKAFGIAARQVLVDLLDDLCIVSPLFVQPEDHRSPRSTGTADRQFHPVVDGGVFHLAHAENIAGFNRLSHDHVAIGIDHTDRSVAGGLECLVVRAVFFGFLGH